MAGFSLEARGSRNIVKVIQTLTNYLGNVKVAVDGVIGPQTYGAYDALPVKGKRVVEALSEFYGFSMAGEFARYEARRVAEKVGEILPTGQANASPAPVGADPRDVTMTPAQVSSFRKALGVGKIASNKRVVGQAIGRAGFTGDDQVALLAWIGVESAGTWDPRIREGGARRGVGGFGFSQWTAGRARALIRYAAATERSASDMKTQTDFFTAELLDNSTARKYNGGTVIGKSGQWGRAALVAALAEAKDLDQKTFVWQTYFFRPAVQSLAKAQSAVRSYA